MDLKKELQEIAKAAKELNVKVVPGSGVTFIGDILTGDAHMPYLASPYGAGNVEASSFSASPDVLKQIEDMKEFMQKDVMELASKDPTVGKAAQTIDVRGRKMAIPADHAVNRTNSLL